ncbi:hypothetical protein CTAYLR_003408 [Chrysophaeum taylorii]|uniref:Uncharacterized protein n=1 Tax=Chrysophaeum taylorii TaxID=2483200 RepID=A0AAD7U7X4_9STRA|nr:hypothetical protein CTAYLR_003408 [Chrysophaeum taylorii]
MSHSHIGELGGLALGVALGACHTLECLDLSFNVIQSGGEAILWNATSLKYLDLSFGSLNDSAADALAHLVCFGHQLEHLNCASNRLGEASGLLVAAALRVGCRCASLASLHLGFQRLGERASLELVRAIAKRTSITTLGVENTTIAGGEQPVIDAAEHATQQRGKPAQVAAEHPQRSVPVPATMVERVESSSGRTLESRKWTLRNSVWKLRPKEADCKAFYDTRAFLDTTAASDLDRSKVLQLLRGNRDEYARVTAVMQRFFGELQLIHRYFSALGEGWPFSIQWNEWRDFVTVCGVTYGQQCNLEELDIVFIAANIPPAGVKETADKVLTRCEFLEAVVRAAIKRYDLLTPAEAVQRLLEREVIPKAREQRVLELGDEYRRKRLYKPGVGILLEKYAKLIDALWTKSRRRLSVISTTSTEIGGGTATRRKHSFTEQGNQFQALAYDDRLLNIDTWLRMVEQTVYEVTTFTQLSARIAYVMSKPTVQQSERRTQAATSATDEHVYLTRTDFNEVLCRSADALIPSSWSVPLDKKLPHLLALFAKHHDITKLFIALGGERDVAIDPWGTTTQVTEEDSASYLDDIQLLRARDLEIRREKALADAEARLCAELRRSTLSMTFQTPSPRPASKERRREQRRKLLSTIKTHVSGWRAACAVFSVSSSSTSPGLHLLLEVRVFLFEPRRTLVMLVESRDLEIVATKIGSIDEVNLAEALVKRLRVQTGVLPRDLSLSVDDSDVMPYTSSMSVCDVQYLRPAEKSSGVTPDAQARDVPDKDTRTDDAVERQRHPGTSHDIIPYEGDQFWHRARLEFARGRIQDLLAKVCEDEGSKISHFDLLAMDYIDLPLSPTNDTLTALSLFERGTPVVAA